MKRSTETRARRAPVLRALFAVLAIVLGCESSSEPATGGETHFLRRCTPSTEREPCGAGFMCLCSVCTLPCSDADACAAYPGAACTPPGAQCGEDTSASYCEVACQRDADCAALSSEHRCQQGACRAGAAECAQGEVSANQVLFIGDSFFAASHQITAYVEDLARNEGALPVGERYRDYSSSVANGLALGGNGIARQYEQAAAEAEVRVVIMTGGGSDVLVGSCETPDASCPVIADAAAGATTLFTDFANGGVAHVVYAFYPDPVDPALREKVDALRPLIQAACAASPVSCHFIDLRAAFAGRYDELVQPDGILPTSLGAQVTAAEIWAVMQAQCIAQ